MALRDFGADEALEKYGKEKGTAEKSGEGWTADRKEFEAVRKEKKLRKPGSVSRFFNQFGIGKYWERLNDYFEQEERMEKEEAERAAAKETAGDVKAAAEEKVGAIKAEGTEMPKKIEASAARAGAEAAEAAPIVAEAKAEETQIEQEAEAARADLGEEVEILEQRPLMDEVKEKYEKKYKDTPLREIDVRIKYIEHQMKAQDNRHDEIEEGLKSGKLFKSDELRAEQKQMEEKREWFETERKILLEIKKEKTPAKAEVKKIKAEESLAWEEAEEPAVAKEAKEGAVPSPAEVKSAEVLSEEIIEPAEEEMEKAKVKPVSLKKKKIQAGPPSIKEIKPVEVLGEEVIGAESLTLWDEVEPATISVTERKKIETGRWEPKISAEFKAHEPKLFSEMEKAFFAKGEKGSKARLERMLSSLEKVGEAYAKQKTEKEISAADLKALKKWIAETKAAINVLQRAPEEMKPVKVVELKKKKKAGRAA
ncbi:hypothetical protein HZB93_01920 [Candidatus Falkowbacteria bacterium]|nr:hypothetical protein [Candidatus Falkowbacteria bacterium]